VSVTSEEQVSSVSGAIVPIDADWEARAWERLDSLTKPPRSLGGLEVLAARVAVAQRTTTPAVDEKAIVVMAGDHGVTAQGVSPYPSEVTAQMVGNFAAGGAAICQLAGWCGADLLVVDVGVASDLPEMTGVLDRKVAHGTNDMTLGPAMTREDAARAVLVGIEVARDLAHGGATLIGTGEMGIGNTTAASALAAVFCDVAPATVVGRGTGLDDEGVARKTAAIESAIAVNAPDAGDPLGVLAAVGGLEIAGLAGVVLGAAEQGVCVVVDGFIAGAAALVALRLAPAARGYVLTSHRSVEPGHVAVLDAIGVPPVLELEMRLGEGSGAALAMGLVDAACRVMSGMATFAEAGVSGADA
jgi:nicotinate-nucleotide--dimethylbenzimidazole phosphoribosyltransferase